MRQTSHLGVLVHAALCDLPVVPSGFARRRARVVASLYPRASGMRVEYGISPHFARDDQRLRYALIHRNLTEIYGLQQGRLACREPVNREIARAIMLALEDRSRMPDRSSIISGRVSSGCATSRVAPPI